MDDLADPLDHLDPDELIEEASKHLLEALEHLDGMRRLLRGEPVLSHAERCNVVRFTTRPISRRRVHRNAARP